MGAAEKLRRLRESLPDKPGTRRLAAELGYDAPNAYGYYESSSFKKDLLPLEKAREFAPIFERLGGSAADVLRLAGLSEDEIAREPAAEPVSLTMIRLAVALPSATELAAMFRGLLKEVGFEDRVDERSETLARRLPIALETASARQVRQSIALTTSAVEPTLPPAMPDLDLER